MSDTVTQQQMSWSLLPPHEAWAWSFSKPCIRFQRQMNAQRHLLFHIIRFQVCNHYNCQQLKPAAQKLSCITFFHMTLFTGTILHSLSCILMPFDLPVFSLQLLHLITTILIHLILCTFKRINTLLTYQQTVNYPTQSLP